MKIRCGYKFNSTVAKAAKFVNDSCPDYCPCCLKGNQTFEYWLFEYPAFNFWRAKLFGNLETVVRLVFNLFNISNYSITINDLIDNNYTFLFIFYNLSNISIINYFSNNSNTIQNNLNVISSVSLDHRFNGLVNNSSGGVNIHSNSLKWRRVYYFLLGGRVNHYNLGKKEWNTLWSMQLKSSSFSDVPLLVRTVALSNKIMPIVDQIWSLFNRFPSNLTKSANAE